MTEIKSPKNGSNRYLNSNRGWHLSVTVTGLRCSEFLFTARRYA